MPPLLCVDGATLWPRGRGDSVHARCFRSEVTAPSVCTSGGRAKDLGGGGFLRRAVPLARRDELRGEENEDGVRPPPLPFSRRLVEGASRGAEVDRGRRFPTKLDARSTAPTPPTARPPPPVPRSFHESDARRRVPPDDTARSFFSSGSGPAEKKDDTPVGESPHPSMIALCARCSRMVA